MPIACSFIVSSLATFRTGDRGFFGIHKLRMMRRANDKIQRQASWKSQWNRPSRSVDISAVVNANMYDTACVDNEQNSSRRGGGSGIHRRRKCVGGFRPKGGQILALGSNLGNLTLGLQFDPLLGVKLKILK